MEKHIKNQITKFKFYGFFKNLRFFDPFLLLYLTYSGVTITQIGILWAIREFTVYIFEIPSGILADNFGRKNELIICFVFYILSFIMFYFGGSFFFFSMAFVLYGLGEAFRSGTHKAMIMEFLEYHNIKGKKSMIYGSTRSFSMLGSTVSSLLSIVLVSVINNLSILFLLSIIPYLLDLVLILSYPTYLNIKTKHRFTFKEFYKSTIFLIINFFKNRDQRLVIADSALYNAIFKTIKDYVQLIMLGILTVSIISNPDEIELYIALIYSFLFFISAISSKYAYKLLSFKHKDYILNTIWLMMSVVSVFFIFTNNSITATLFVFSLLYILLNIRKPLMIEKISEVTNNNQRASILSVESQLTSLMIIIMAPIFGYLYDNYGVNVIFATIASIGLFVVLIKQMKSARLNIQGTESE